MAPSARGLGRRPAAAGDQPGLRGVGTHTPEDAQYVFQKFPPNLVVLKSPPRPSGLARCPHSYTRASIPRPLEKPPGLGRRGPGSVSKPVPESPALGLLAPASPPAATEEIFAGDSCSGCGGLESVFQARGGALVARTATPGLARLPSSGSGLSRSNPQQSAAEAASPAEKSNSNLRRGDFPHPGPAGVSLAAAAHAGGHPRRRTRDHSARTRAHGRRPRPPVK